MKLWVVKLDCGDYYCDGNHIAGIYSTEELAKARKAELNRELAEIAEYPAKIRQYSLNENVGGLTPDDTR